VVQPSYLPQYHAISDNALFPCVWLGHPLFDRLRPVQNAWNHLLLDDVKPGNTWFLVAIASVFNRGSPESFNLVGLNMRKNMDYKHNILLIGINIQAEVYQINGV